MLLGQFAEETGVSLTAVEKEVYDLIRRSGEVLTTEVPAKMRGAIPHLIRKRLVEVYKKPTNPWTSKKRKFLRPINIEPNQKPKEQLS
ncbi:hypothetical protein B6U79_00555 [Candidatus Bathyarchaeota archaeon ex4484_231]|nr:MAG: hypothetical protein B6U79_00555 [Candidatus Bathyarchaeota archaeon ex4484_231]